MACAVFSLVVSSGCGFMDKEVNEAFADLWVEVAPNVAVGDARDKYGFYLVCSQKRLLDNITIGALGTDALIFGKVEHGREMVWALDRTKCELLGPFEPTDVAAIQLAAETNDAFKLVPLVDYLHAIQRKKGQ
jgi:hypothetical protein